MKLVVVFVVIGFISLVESSEFWETLCLLPSLYGDSEHVRRKRDTEEISFEYLYPSSTGRGGETSLVSDLFDLLSSYCHTRQKRDAESESKILDDLIVPPPFPDAVKDGDSFFTSYGGDIEYFFPLLSFGIPFDGEITFLGFHGFKGLFPYK